MIRQTTWLKATALIGGDLEFFSSPVMEDLIVAGPSVPKRNNNNNNNKKTAPQEATFSSQDWTYCFVLF